MNSQRSKIMLALAGASGPVLFTVITLIAHLLRPGYDWVGQTISELALGENGWLAICGLALFGALTIVLALALFLDIEKRHGFRTAIILLILCGVGFILLSIFSTDVRGSPVVTLRGLVHQGSVRVITSLFPLACFLLIPSLKNDRRWHNLLVYTVVTGILALVIDVLWAVLPGEFLKPRLGLYERILTAIALVWMEVTAVRLLLLILRNKREHVQAVKGESS